MPSCAAPCATKVATSKARTRIRRKSSRSQAKVSERLSLSWKLASGTTPARAITGKASSRIRPLGMAKVSGAFMSACEIAAGGQRAMAVADASYEVIDPLATGAEAVIAAFRNQVAYCRDNGAPNTALICQALRRDHSWRARRHGDVANPQMGRPAAGRRAAAADSGRAARVVPEGASNLGSSRSTKAIRLPMRWTGSPMRWNGTKRS